MDAADYVWWRKNDGTPTGYNTWRANFGHTAAGGGGVEVTSVPEPMSGVMVVIAFFIFLLLSFFVRSPAAPFCLSNYNPRATAFHGLKWQSNH